MSRLYSVPLPSDHFYRAILALNAYGTTLLARGRFADARDTLTDAATVAKAAIQTPGHSTANLADFVTTADVDAKVHAALLRTLTMTPEDQPHTNLVELPKTILTVTTRGTFHITAPTFRPGEVYMLLLDIDTDPDADEDWLSLMSCLTLINMAFVYSCLSRASPGSDDLEVKAIHLFELARSLAHLFAHDHYKRDQSALGLSLQIESIILFGMIPVLRNLGRSAKADIHGPRVSFLKKMASDLAEENDLFFQIFKLASPAA